LKSEKLLTAGALLMGNWNGAVGGFVGWFSSWLCGWVVPGAVDCGSGAELVLSV